MNHTSIIERIVRAILLTLIVVFFLFPIFWILLMSFQSNEQILRIPPSLTFAPTFDNYKALISGHLGTSAGTLDIFVIGSASPVEDSRRVMANESGKRNRDGNDERSLRWM